MTSPKFPSSILPDARETVPTGRSSQTAADAAALIPLSTNNQGHSTDTVTSASPNPPQESAGADQEEQAKQHDLEAENERLKGIVANQDAAMQKMAEENSKLNHRVEKANGALKECGRENLNLQFEIELTKRERYPMPGDLAAAQSREKKTAASLKLYREAHDELEKVLVRVKLERDDAKASVARLQAAKSQLQSANAELQREVDTLQEEAVASSMITNKLGMEVHQLRKQNVRLLQEAQDAKKEKVAFAAAQKQLEMLLKMSKGYEPEQGGDIHVHLGDKTNVYVHGTGRRGKGAGAK